MQCAPWLVGWCFFFFFKCIYLTTSKPNLILFSVFLFLNLFIKLLAIHFEIGLGI